MSYVFNLVALVIIDLLLKILTIRHYWCIKYKLQIFRHRCINVSKNIKHKLVWRTT